MNITTDTFKKQIIGILQEKKDEYLSEVSCFWQPE